MAYNEQLAAQIRKVRAGNPAVTEKKDVWRAELSDWREYVLWGDQGQ